MNIIINYYTIASSSDVPITDLSRKYGIMGRISRILDLGPSG